MTARTEWSVSEPRTLEIEEAVESLTVRVVGGTVNVVGTREKGAARVEVGEVTGAPLRIGHEGGALTVGYEDLPGSGLWSFLDQSGWRRAAVVSVTVPVGTAVDVGGIGVDTVLSHLDGPVTLRTVSGGATLVGLAGPVRVQTASGAVQAQDVRGGLRFHSVSGDLTALACGGRLHADSVGGDMTVDLDGTGQAVDIGLTTVSGDVALRLPDPADATVEAGTASGAVSNAFDDLRVSGGWGARRLTGRLGEGSGRLRITTVSGGLALLRRPRGEDPAEDRAPRSDSPGAARDADGPDTATTPSAQRKVL